MSTNKIDYILNNYTERLVLTKSVSDKVYNNEFNKLLNLKHIREKFDNKITIKNIFSTFWSKFKSKFKDKLRPSVINNVESIIGCKDYKNGYIAYSCNTCDEYSFTAFSCNSRFCSTCGKKYRDSKSIEIQSKLLNVTHRHFVFTIAKELRDYFFKFRDMQNLLFYAVNNSLVATTLTSKRDQLNEVKLGFISFQKVKKIPYV